MTPTLVKMKEGSAGSNGLLGGSSITDVDNYPNRQGQTGTKTLTIPRDTTGGPKEGAGRIKRIQSRMAQKTQQSATLRRLAKKVRMVDTSEGIRIDLVDDANFAMFQLGTTVLTSDATQLLTILGEAISPEPGTLAIRGHTDALQWRPGDVANNWSLSAGRAEATRQALMRSGIAENRFRRIEGVADREPLIRENPQDPRNRRIAVVVAR